MNPLLIIQRLIQGAADIPDPMKQRLMQQLMLLPDNQKQALLQVLRTASGASLGAVLISFLSGGGLAPALLGGGMGASLAYNGAQSYLPSYVTPQEFQS
jgi:hypothetical protein